MKREIDKLLERYVEVKAAAADIDTARDRIIREKEALERRLEEELKNEGKIYA